MAEFERVGVVIPTYNRADMLREALRSVLDQTVPAAEIVVVDDGSTDDTPGVVAEFAGAGAPIRLLAGPHTNERSASRNRGVDALESPLVAFLDSDDIWKPERLERQLGALRQHPEAGFAFCNVHRFNERGLIGTLPCLLPSADYNGTILGDVLLEPLAVSSTLLVRREALQEVGGFAPMRMNEDYELTLRLAARFAASYVPDVLVLMREHEGRTSRAKRDLPLLDYISIVERFIEAHPDMPSTARARARQGLANVHLKLARLYTELGEREHARKHLLASMRLRPLDRRVYSAYVRLASTHAPAKQGA